MEDLLSLENLDLDKDLRTYMEAIREYRKIDKVSEATYYSEFKKFLERIFPSEKGYLIQVEPSISSKSEKIRPDFAVMHNGNILFYIEAKLPEADIEADIRKPGSKLNKQIHRYVGDGKQLLLTDFCNIWVIDNKKNFSDREDIVSAIKFKAKLIEKKDSDFVLAENAEDSVKNVFSYVCEDYVKTITNVSNIIAPLAEIGKELRDKTKELMRKGNRFGSDLRNTNARLSYNYLKAIFDDFNRTLFNEETDDIDLFADLFSQTIIYGAFSAWVRFCQEGNSPRNFSIEEIGAKLPIGSFLRELFLRLKDHTPEQFRSYFKRIIGIFRKADYRKLSNPETLITTFYSEFLHKYDPQTAKDRGVVYTPAPIVRFIISGIDFLLSHWFDMKGGIISEYFPKGYIGDNILPASIKILDPAAGTMAFAAGYLQYAKEKFDALYSGNDTLSLLKFGDWVKERFFPNMFAFEILMAPYVLGQIRIFLTLESLGISLNQKEYRLNSFLMNTLMSPPTNKTLDNLSTTEIKEEIRNALTVRDKEEIYIVMGNPPYNVSTQNNCKWINDKIKDYKEGLNEKNLKILSDDYVKFIRFAQWKIESVGKGIVAYITNNKFLDGQVYYIMRKSLRKTFDHIYIVNLLGDQRKKQSGNVFDIRVGVCITFMVRLNDKPNKKAAIHYMEIDAKTKNDKFRELAKGFMLDKFILLPETKKDLFVPIDMMYYDRFYSFISVDKFFANPPKTGVMIGKDHLLTDVDKEVLEWKIHKFFNKDYEELEKVGVSVKDTKSWKKETIFSKTCRVTVLKSIIKLKYRGFDFRYFAYERNIVEGPRWNYLKQINSNNIALTVSKSSRKDHFCTAFVCDTVPEKCYLAKTDTIYVFPMKLDGESNISIPEEFTEFAQNNPEEMFYYIYAILFTPLYRERYDEFLRKEFPRIPVPRNPIHFYKMASYGRQLVKLHLLREGISEGIKIVSRRPGDLKIGNIMFNKAEKRIYFDRPKYRPKNLNMSEWAQKNEIPWVEGISEEMWNFELGGKKQLENFLKSRKFFKGIKWDHLSRPLNYEEVEFFLKMCSAIKGTIEIQSELNEIYEKIDPK